MFDAFRDKEQEHTDSVPHDRFDQAMWDEVREDSAAVADMVTGLRRKYDYVDDFTKDIFNLLAKGDPDLRSPQDMRATHVPNRQMVESLASLPELQALRQYTVADGFNSAAGMLSLGDEIKKALARTEDLREQAEEAQQKRDDAQRLAEEAAQDPADNHMREAANEAAAEAQQAMEQLQAQAEAAAAGERNQMRQALKAATDEAQEAQETALAYGVSSGDLQRMNFADRLALAQRLSGRKLKEFAKLIGAFRALAAAEYRRRVNDVADEQVGVEFGDDLTRLTTQELINMASPELEDDFWRRYAERSLLVKRLRGKEHEGRGPIIVVADESGSMAGAGEMWAKGLALALLDQAHREKRDFTYIGFSSEHDPLREFHFPAGKTNRLAVLDMAEGFLNGGTTFGKPLRRALDLLATSAARPDIVFVTDGEAPTPPFINEWHATRQRLTAKCFGIYVSSYGGMPANLSVIADDVRTVSDLADVHQVRDIMRQS